MTNFLATIGTNWTGIFWRCWLNERFTFVTNFLGTISTNWAGIFWGRWLNPSFTLVTNFLRAVSTDWTGIFWCRWLNPSFTLVTNFLRAISTDWTSIFWGGWLDSCFAFVTNFLRAFSTCWRTVFRNTWLNERFSLVPDFLTTLLPTFFFRFLISSFLLWCLIVFYGWFKPFKNSLQRLFKFRFCGVTKIANIFVTINGDDTLSQILCTSNCHGLIKSTQFLILQSKYFNRHKESLTCSPDQNQTNKFFTVFF